MARKPCLDCDNLTTNGTRCTTCTSAQNRARDQRRGNTTQRGYGYRHQKARADLLADNPLCAYCGVRRATHADHITPISRDRDNPNPQYLPACDHCNLSKGNTNAPKTKPQVTGGAPRFRRSEA